jgi:ubiquitin-protein ligase
MGEITSELALNSFELQVTNRWNIEQERLRKFPAFKLYGTSGKITSVEGALDTQYGNTYGLRIELADYPYSMPKVFPKGWSIHPSVTHKYNDGSLCLMRPSQWRRQYTIALVIAKAAIWLGKYEMWKRNDHVWPGLEQKH